MSSKRPLYKIVIVGSAKTGKSALTLQFMYNEFVIGYEPNTGGMYNKGVTLDEDEIQINILDYAGSLYHHYENFCFGEGFLCVFSIDDESGFKLTHGRNCTSYVELVPSPITPGKKWDVVGSFLMSVIISK